MVLTKQPRIQPFLKVARKRMACVSPFGLSASVSVKVILPMSVTRPVPSCGLNALPVQVVASTLSSLRGADGELRP